MVKIIDLSVKLEDFMPSHKNLQRPFVKPHVTHEESKSRKLGAPEDPMTFTTTFMAMVDHTGTHVDAFYHNTLDGLPVDEMPLEMFEQARRWYDSEEYRALKAVRSRTARGSVVLVEGVLRAAVGEAVRAGR